MINLDIKRKLRGANGPFELHAATSIQKGELVTLYGPNGAGKSSILRMIAGLMTPDAGRIRVGSETWFDHASKTNLRTQYRNIGMVFQEHSLFPNMTVRENLMFALSKREDRKIVDELLEMSGMSALANEHPTLLSGGQKQRVALTRALVRKPTLLLLDEPLSALDSEMRRRLQDYILMFHTALNLTTLLVSHDYPEIARMSSRVLVLEDGSIKRDCSPADLLG